MEIVINKPFVFSGFYTDFLYYSHCETKLRMIDDATYYDLVEEFIEFLELVKEKVVEKILNKNMASWGKKKEEEPIRFTSGISPFLPSHHPALSSSSSLVQLDPKNAVETGRRLYIGNLHRRITEFHLLKILHPFGSLEGFKYVYQNIGAETEGQKRFAFVTFTTLEAAQKCMRNLNGKLVCGRTLRLRWAPNLQMRRSANEERVKAMLPVLGFKGTGAQEYTEEEKEELKLQREKLINAIEAKLQAIEKEKAET